MAKKKKQRRTRAQRLADMKRKVAEEEAKLALDSLKNAVKSGLVEDENTKEYKRLLGYLRAMEKAPSAFSYFDMDDEAAAAAKLRDRIIKKLKAMLSDGESGSDDSEEEEESESESDEEESDDDEEEEEEDGDDDDF